MNRETCMELMRRPASSLTAVEQYVVNKFCDQHPDIVDQVLREHTVTTSDVPSKKTYVYGLDGIMQLFGCSKTTAQKIKNGGRLDKAITQIGRKIVIDADMALKLYSLSSPRVRR